MGHGVVVIMRQHVGASQPFGPHVILARSFFGTMPGGQVVFAHVAGVVVGHGVVVGGRQHSVSVHVLLAQTMSFCFGLGAQPGVAEPGCALLQVWLRQLGTQQSAFEQPGVLHTAWLGFGTGEWSPQRSQVPPQRSQVASLQHKVAVHPLGSHFSQVVRLM